MTNRFLGLISVFIFIAFGVLLFFLYSPSGVALSPDSCNKGYLNQIYDVNVWGNGAPSYLECILGNNVTTNTTCHSVNSSVIDAFTVPLDYDYQGLEIVNASILARCTPANRTTNCHFSINGNPCGTFGSGNVTGIGGKQIYPIACLSSIRAGINTIAVTPQESNLLNPINIFPENGTISKVFVEMKIVPTNC